MNDARIACPRCASVNTALAPDGLKGICFDCNEIFSVPGRSAAVQPLRIFISYGHPEDEICTRICAFLKSRGHTVWLDKEKIHHGQDWRQRIIQGIESSNGVLACLSRHSTRDPGVCLDELTIAVGVKGGVIKSVLLDEEDRVQPPSSISHMQWLDMHDWRARLQTDAASFESWCQGKLTELAEAVESRETYDFVGKIQSIRRALNVHNNTDRQKYYLRQRFVGREWLTEMIEAWLDDPDGEQLCVLYGDPGVGKSAFAAHYAHYNARVAAGIFCRVNENYFNSEEYVIKMLAYLLACRIPPYREVLAERLTMGSVDRLNGFELFRFLMEEPLNMLIDGNHETLCVVIDGVDECGTPEKNPLADMLGRYAGLLPRWIRILVTGRSVIGVKSPLQSRFSLSIHSDDAHNLADLRAYYREVLADTAHDDADEETLLDDLLRRSEGSFLYANLLANGLKQGKVSLSDLNVLPHGLSEILYSWFTWFFPDVMEYRKEFRLPMGAILASPEPLPVNELKRLFAWDDNSLRDFFSRISVLLQRNTDPFGMERVVFSHKFIAEWLKSEENLTYNSSENAALSFMSEKFLSMYSADAKSLSDYEVRYIIPYYLVAVQGMDSLKGLGTKDYTAYSRCFEYRELAPVVQSHAYCMRLLSLASKTRSDYTERFNSPPDYYGTNDMSLVSALVLYRAVKEIYMELDELLALDEELDRTIVANEAYIEHLKGRV